MKTAPAFLADVCLLLSVREQAPFGLAPLTYLDLEQELFCSFDATSSALHSFHNYSGEARRLLDHLPGGLDIVILPNNPVLPVDRILRNLAAPKAKDGAVVPPTEDGDLVPARERPRGVERVHVGLGARVCEAHALQAETLAYERRVPVLLARRGAQVQADVVKGRDDGLADDGVRVAVNAGAELSDQVEVPGGLVNYSVAKDACV